MNASISQVLLGKVCMHLLHKLEKVTSQPII